MASSLILTNEMFEVHYRPGSSKFCLITFNEMGMRSDGRRFWAQRIAEKFDYTAIGFVSHGQNWFPKAPMLEAIEELQPLLSGSNTLYGFSMGAYACIKYSKLLNAKKVIAFSPLVSIRPDDVPHDRRWHGLYRPGLHDDMKITDKDVQGEIEVIFDPLDVLDASHARVLLELPKSFGLRMPLCGHQTVAIAAEFPGFSQIIDRFSEARDRVGDYLRSSRRLSKTFWFGLAVNLLDRKKPGWCLRAIDESTLLCGAKPDSHRALTMKALAFSGRIPEALAILCDGTPAADDARVPLWLADTADLISAHGHLAEALRLYTLMMSAPTVPTVLRFAKLLMSLEKIGAVVLLCQEMARRFPKDSSILAFCGYKMMEQREFCGALSMFDNALARAPGTLGLHFAKIQALDRLKDMESALAAVDAALSDHPANGRLLDMQKLYGSKAANR